MLQNPAPKLSRSGFECSGRPENRYITRKGVFEVIYCFKVIIGQRNRVVVNSVITADLVESTRRSMSQKRLAVELTSIFSDLADFIEPGGVLLPFTLFRGDSFQGVLAGVENTLLAALYLRCSIRRQLQLDVRQALGLGRTDELVSDSTLQSTGEAFVCSGRLLDDMTKHRKQFRRIAVASSSEQFDAEFNTHFELLEAIVEDWTDRESEAVFLKLHKWTQTEIAEYLNINQSAVHKRLKAAKWTAVVELLNRWGEASVRMMQVDQS